MIWVVSNLGKRRKRNPNRVGKKKRDDERKGKKSKETSLVENGWEEDQKNRVHDFFTLCFSFFFDMYGVGENFAFVLFVFFFLFWNLCFSFSYFVGCFFFSFW